MLHEAQLTTLRKHGRALINDLELTADLLATFLEHGIFNEDDIDKMKAEKTRKDEVYKMLTILKRRHPRAFGKFVHAINKDHYWLAKNLRDTYHNIKHKKDPDMLDLKEKVAVYVHEEFGNSKRLCEEDKRSIRNFLHRQLKHLHDDEVLLHAGPRRASLDSTDSARLYLEQKKELQNEAESDTIHRAYQVLCSLLSQSETDDPSAKSLEGNANDMDAEVTEVTVDMLEGKINEVVTQFQDLKSEIDNCHKALGISQQECDRPLHEVLTRLMAVRQKDHEKIKVLQERANAIDKQRLNLEDALDRKKLELEELCKDLGKAEYGIEKRNRINAELQEKVTQLEQTRAKFQTLKTMAKGISQDDLVGFDDVDGGHTRKSVNLPPLVDLSNRHRKAESKGRGITPKHGIDPLTSPWKF